MINPTARTPWTLSKGDGIGLSYKQGACYYSGSKIKYCGDTSFKTVLIFVKFAVEMLPL